MKNVLYSFNQLISLEAALKKMAQVYFAKRNILTHKILIEIYN